MLKWWLLLSLLVVYESCLFSQSNDNLRVKWNRNLIVENEEKTISLKFGGRLQYDVMFMHQDITLSEKFNAENGSEFRRVRLFAAGRLYTNVEFKIQLEFANGPVELKDVFVRYTQIPFVGNLQAGNFKEPMGFEMLMSSNDIPEMERSLTDVFSPDRNLGFMAFNSILNKRLTMMAGYFYNSQGLSHVKGNTSHFTARLVSLPLFADQNQFQLIHVGISYSHQFHDNGEIVYASHPESHLAPKYLEAIFDEVYAVNKLAGELALAHNQFTLQSEYYLNSVIPGSESKWKHSNYTQHAWYVTAGWTITGEHKIYNRNSATFGRIVPKKNLGEQGGWGAFEVTARYSSLNMNSFDFTGGKMNDLTIGLNWFLNPATRVMANYIYAGINASDHANIFQMRFQVAF